LVLSDLDRSIEALLYVADNPLSTEELAQILSVDNTQVEASLIRLCGALEEHGIRLQRSGNQVQLVTAPQTSAVVENYLGLDATNKLSPAALETLAIIAYKQPITRAQIEGLRGVNCEGSLHSLASRALIASVGRLEQAGRPVLYATTFEFLQYLGLTSLSELPPLPDAVFSAL
jgi:segregation and condensation protein B